MDGHAKKLGEMGGPTYRVNKMDEACNTKVGGKIWAHSKGTDLGL